MRTVIILLSTAAALLAESAAGLSWTAPSGWVSKGATQMRAATYAVGDAECVVYFFGQGQGGSVEANMTRWNGQFTSGGKPVAAKTAKRTIHGLAVSTMDVTGTYAGMSGGSMTPDAPKGDYRMLAAIVEGPGGNIFVKFTGPAKSIAANQAKYQSLLESIRK